MECIQKRFVDWIIQLIKVRRTVTPEETTASLKAGITASLRSGTTAVGDIVSTPELLSVYDGAAIDGRIYLELIGQDMTIFSPRLDNAVAAAKLLKGGLSPHSPYTINRTLLPSIALAARRHSLPLSVHLAESHDESDFLFNSSGQLAEELYPFVGWEGFIPSPLCTTPVRFFDGGGLLGPETLAVHSVQVTPADAAILKERGVTVCLCPRSNQQLDVGIAPVRMFKKLGIPLCIGTDSLASNDSLSLWDEIRFAMDLYKGELIPEELLQMATSGGASGIGLGENTGFLETGKRADFQVVQLNGHCTAESLLTQGQLREVFAGGAVVS